MHAASERLNDLKLYVVADPFAFRFDQQSVLPWASALRTMHCLGAAGCAMNSISGSQSMRRCEVSHACHTPCARRGAHYRTHRLHASSGNTTNGSGADSSSGVAAQAAHAAINLLALSRRQLLQAGAVGMASFMLHPLQPAAAEAAMLVGPKESGGKFQTITEAIAAAEAGATITVLPGRYNERLLVQGKFLTIQSAQVGFWVCARGMSMGTGFLWET